MYRRDNLRENFTSCTHSLGGYLHCMLLEEVIARICAQLAPGPRRLPAPHRPALGMCTVPTVPTAWSAFQVTALREHLWCEPLGDGKCGWTWRRPLSRSFSRSGRCRHLLVPGCPGLVRKSIPSLVHLPPPIWSSRLFLRPLSALRGGCFQTLSRAPPGWTRHILSPLLWAPSFVN